MQKLSNKMQMLVQIVVVKIAFVVKSTTTDKNGLSPMNYSAERRTEMVWRVIEHIGYSVVAVQDFETEDEALEYKQRLERRSFNPYWVSIQYCNRDDVAYYSNA